MITLQDLYDRVIDQINIETSRYTSAKFLMDVTMIVQDIWSEVVKKRQWNSNWDIWTSDTVSLQDEYTKPFVSSEDVWADYIETLSINYDWETYTETWSLKYIPCKLATNEQINNWEYYLECQSKSNPIYFQRDKSVFIAPEPRTTEVWVNRIKITWIRSIDTWNWTLATTETETKLPLQMLETIVVWCVWKASIVKRLAKNEINDYKNDYLLEKQNSIYKMENNWVFYNDYPM